MLLNARGECPEIIHRPVISRIVRIGIVCRARSPRDGAPFGAIGPVLLAHCQQRVSTELSTESIHQSG